MPRPLRRRSGEASCQAPPHPPRRLQALGAQCEFTGAYCREQVSDGGNIFVFATPLMQNRFVKNTTGGGCWLPQGGLRRLHYPEYIGALSDNYEGFDWTDCGGWGGWAGRAYWA